MTEGVSSASVTSSLLETSSTSAAPSSTATAPSDESCYIDLLDIESKEKNHLIKQHHTKIHTREVCTRCQLIQIWI